MKKKAVRSYRWFLLVKPFCIFFFFLSGMKPCFLQWFYPFEIFNVIRRIASKMSELKRGMWKWVSWSLAKIPMTLYLRHYVLLVPSLLTYTPSPLLLRIFHMWCQCQIEAIFVKRLRCWFLCIFWSTSEQIATPPHKSKNVRDGGRNIFLDERAAEGIF